MATITPGYVVTDAATGSMTSWSGDTPNPVYSGTFIPTIWSGKLIEKFYDATVLAAISNTDYEGEIKNYGDKVIIRQKPTLTINDYEADGTLSFERPSASTVELAIDEARYFAAVVDDVYEIQADLNMLSLWSDDASEQMKINIDTTVLDGILGAASSTNRGATAGRISGNIDLGVTTSAITLTSSNIIDHIVKMGQCLDENNIPETGRWLILPAWVCSLIKRSELRDASLTGDSVSLARNGRLGMIDRFTLYMSNLLPDENHASLTTDEWGIYAGHSHGLTFASQMSKVETIRAESTFGTILRGLQVFGYKVTDGTALVESIVTP